MDRGNEFVKINENGCYAKSESRLLPFFHGDHAAVARFHGNAPCVVRLDGEGAAVACCPGRQCGRGRGTRAADPAFRTGLLFGHLPAGRLSGCRVAGGRPAAEEPLPLLAGAVVAALRHTGAVPRGAGRPFQARVEPAGALQRLRRIVSNLLHPFYLWGNNLLAYLAERAGSYAFYTVDVWVKGAATLAVAAVTFIVLAVLAWRNGRTYWLVCPVGDSGGSCRASRFSSRASTPRNATAAAFVPATARRRASTRRRTGSITAVAWPAWTVWGNAVRGRSPFRANPPLTANPMPATNPMPWNLRP